MNNIKRSYKDRSCRFCQTGEEETQERLEVSVQGVLTKLKKNIHIYHTFIFSLMIWSSKLDAGELYSDSYCHSCKSVCQITFGEYSSGSKDAGCNANSHSDRVNILCYFLPHTQLGVGV